MIFAAPFIFLSCRFRHIFDEDPLSRSEIVDQDMGHRDYKFSVPEDRTAHHE